MQEIKKALVLPTLEYYETHLSLLNCILPVKMTPMEIKVLATFMSLTGEVAKYRFGPTAKKIVMSNIKDKKPLSPAGLSNYMGSLKRKKLLLGEEDMLSIHPILVPEDVEQLYRFRLVNDKAHTPISIPMHQTINILR